MGFFSKIKKGLRKVAKIARVTAPLWSSFIPGGGIVGQVLGRTGKLGGIAGGISTAVGRARQLRTSVRGTQINGANLAAVQARSAVEEARFENQGIGPAGIKGPVPMKQYGRMISPSILMRGGGGGMGAVRKMGGRMKRRKRGVSKVRRIARRGRRRLRRRAA